MLADPVLRSGGRVLVDALRLHGVDRVFCVPGESYLDVLDALHDTPEIDLVVAKHEGGAALMAEADGKLTGRPGVCFVTRGPGATHAAIGVHTAQQDSTPLILFIGQVERAHRGREAFQEVDYEKMFGGIAKLVLEIDDAEEIPDALSLAFGLSTSDRPGPVVISLPEDMLGDEVAVSDTAPYRALHAPALPEHVEQLLTELRSAQKPLVIVGGSTWTQESSAALRSFLEHFHLSVTTSFRRQDLFPNDHECYAGHLGFGLAPGLADRLKNADLILAFGTRLGDVTTKSYTSLVPPRLAQRLVHVHIDPRELGRVFDADFAIHANPASLAIALAGVDAPSTVPWLEWTRLAHQDFVDFTTPPAEFRGEGVDLAAVITYLAHRLPTNATVSNGAGNYTAWIHRFYRYRAPRTELAPTNGTMGYGLPAAIAAKLRYPDRISVCVCGDGCFQMYPQELATAKQFGAAMIVIVVNNGLYGTIRMHQEMRFPGRLSGTVLQDPDFVALAHAYGAYGESVGKAKDFPAAFERAVAAGKPALIELRTDPRHVLPDKWSL